jgi:hypothetical protein
MLPAMTAPLRALRTRVWPTRRAFDHRLDRLEGRLDALGARLDDLGAEQRRLVDWLAEVRTRARRSQALAARCYESLQGWPQLLAEARARPDYDVAYTETDPLVTVAISTYHSPDTLCERSLASVLAQTHSNWEAIVVGDHCTDNTAERVAAIGDPRIRFHNLAVRENDPIDPVERWAVKGSVPRAVGMEMARGRWIAPMSHDDSWDPDHLETLLAAAREHRAELCYSRLRVVDAEQPGLPQVDSIGAFPPRLGQFGCQASIIHGGLRFLRYDRVCALAGEPNDWNLARRAWEAGVRFHFVDRETATLYVYDRWGPIRAELAEAGLPPSAAAQP